MAYIEVRTTLPDHRKAKAMARELGLRRPWVIGHLVCLWAWALDNVPLSGSLAGITPADLEEAAQWPEERAGELEPAMTRHGFIEVERRERFLHDWEDYTGRLLRRREEDRERKRSERAARRNGVDSSPKADAKRPKSETASSGRPADKAAGPKDSPGTSEGKRSKSATPRAPARAPAPRRTAPHRTAPSTGTEEAPSARARDATTGGSARASLITLDRPDVAALRDRGWKRLSAKQLAMLDEIAWRQCDGDPELRPAVLDSGRRWSATVIDSAPHALRAGKLLEHLVDHENSIRASRQRAADSTEADWTATKAAGPGPIAAELVAVMGAATANGSSGLTREAAIEQLRALRGQVPAEHWAVLLERHHVSDEDLEDPVDFSEPQEAVPDA